MHLVRTQFGERVAGGGFRSPLVAAIACLVVPSSPLVAQSDDAPLQRTTLIENGDALGVGRLVADLELVAIDDTRTTLRELVQGKRCTVVTMTSVACPISKKYAPRLAALERSYADADVAFVYVNTVATETLPEMREQIRDNGFAGLYLADRGAPVATALQARSTAEVFVLDASRTLVYRGAVDDQYGVGTSLPEPRRHFLRDAVDAVLAGKRPGARATWPPGCLLDARKAPAPRGELTYYGRVARVLADKCVTCHRRGADAPFSLESPNELRGRLSMVEAVVRDGLMPPWHEAPAGPDAAARWANHRALTHREREDLLAWLRSSQPLGDPSDAPAIPPLPTSWWIGYPDLILSTVTVDLPADGPMQYARLVTPTGLVEDRWLAALELRPTKVETVHHALVWVLPPGAALPRLGELPTELELLGAYSPGDDVFHFDGDAGRRLAAGSLLIVDLYALPMGQEMRTRMRIGMRFADEPSDRVLRTRTLSCDALSIPADAAGVHHTASLVLERDTELVALIPYMRARGRALRVEAHLPDGGVSTLLNAARYDYRWQIRYAFVEALRLPAGTRIVLSGEHDNSAANPNNPNAGRPARAGPGVTDDALLVVLETVESAGTTSR